MEVEDFDYRGLVLLALDESAMVVCAHCPRLEEQCDRVGLPLTCGFVDIGKAQAALDLGFSHLAQRKRHSDDVAE